MFAAAETVDHDAYAHTAPAGPLKRFQHPVAGVVQVEYIGFQMHHAPGTVDGLAKGRKEFDTAVQQINGIAVTPVNLRGLVCHCIAPGQGSSSSASRGA